MLNVRNMIEERDPHEKEFHQAVNRVVTSIAPLMEQRVEYRAQAVLERLIEPERTISFRVPWEDDQGQIRVNRGFRIQMNSAVGPYKGGLRFHPSVSQSILKFLAFEQVFKNALTTMPMGAAFGGSDFDPHGKSDREVMQFCQNFMAELNRHIGADRDIPEGDIGVGAREIGYLFGMYNRLQNEFTGAITGKGLAWGRNMLPPQARPFPVSAPVNSFRSRLYMPKRYPISLVPTPMSLSGISWSGPMWWWSSAMKFWQNFMISWSDFPLGSKSDPPKAPPMGMVVRAFLKTCSKARNFKML